MLIRGGVKLTAAAALCAAAAADLNTQRWYRVDTTRISEDLKKKFVQLHPDEETKEFLSVSIDKSSWVWTQIWYLLAKAVLRHFWSITDINGSLLTSHNSPGASGDRSVNALCKRSRRVSIAEH
ncbi:unnamed protein product, partial [Iphiclides podalirius]